MLADLTWLQKVIDQVIKTYLLQEGNENNWLDIPLPNLTETDGAYASTVIKWQLDIYGRLALVLAMAPHLKPEVLDIFFAKNQLYDRGFTEFGGVIDKSHTGFIPTGQTLCFLMTVNNSAMRTKVMDVLGKDSILIKKQVIVMSDTEAHVPMLNGILGLSERWFQYFITGQELQVELSESFLAQKITTNMQWSDIVLDDVVMEQVMEINTWLKHGDTLMKEWGLQNKIKPGYRALFYGPPGTGKTLTATLIGKAANRDVYKVDISMVISKYIGETEKNISRIFDIAKDKSWILFFDEADAVFGKRTVVNSSHNRYDNQQIAYLLQRIDDFPGIVIMATNLKANMDDAFNRKLQTMIQFNMPTPTERYQLRQNAFAATCTLSPDIDLYKVAANYELAGGGIINVLRFCALSAIRRNDTVVTKKDLLTGIKKEFEKENKTISITDL